MISGAMLRRRSLIHRIAAGGGTGNGPDDEFVWGSSIDTAGLRYFGAYPWTLENVPAGSTNAVGSGVLSLVEQGTNAMNPMLATEDIDAGDGIWQTKCAMPGAAANFLGLGLVLREASTGKQLLLGYATDSGAIRCQIRRMTSYTSWTSNYGGTGISDYDGYLEIIRAGSLLMFLRSENATDWTEEARVAQTVDFTTAPSKVGLWLAAQSNLSPSVTASFEYFRKVTRAVPYNVPIVNPGAELAIAAPWTNVTGTLGTRAGVQRTGGSAFKINGNPGAFEVYQEWTSVGFNALFDAGGRTATFAGWGNPWTGATTSYHLRLNAYDAGGSSLGTVSTSNWTPTGTYSQKSAVLSVPTGTRKLRMTIEGTTTASDDGWWDDLTLVIT